MTPVAAFLQEVAGKLIAPQSWGAWAALLFGAVSCGLLLYDRITGKGKSMAKLDGKIEELCGDMKELKETQGLMDTHLSSLSNNVRDLTHEWRGVEGNNGWKSTVRELRNAVASIQRRNDRIDAVTEHEQKRMREEGRKPERLRDRINQGEE